MSEVDELLQYVFEGNDRSLLADFEGWVRSSRRFRAFAMSHRSKIRAKLKSVKEEDGMQDLRAELAAAALLLREERFTLEYEKYASSGQRGPDFTVTFKTHTPFNVEVRHVRRRDLNDQDPFARSGKLVAVLCDKVGQMPPSIVNLLWLAPEGEISEEELDAATTLVRELAERKADAFFARCGYKGASDFLRQYVRLSGVVLSRAGGRVVWLNPLARHEAPQAIATAIRRL